MDGFRMEFHVRKAVRDRLGIDGSLFEQSGNVLFADFMQTRLFAQKYNDARKAEGSDPVGETAIPGGWMKAGQLNAMGLIDEILHCVCEQYREDVGRDAFADALAAVEAAIGKKETDNLIGEFSREFPPLAVYRGEMDLEAYLSAASGGRSNRERVLEEILLCWLANDNPAFRPFIDLFDDSEIRKRTAYSKAIGTLRQFFSSRPAFGPDDEFLVDMLKAPAIAVPNSLPGQLEYIRTRWGKLLAKFRLRLLSSLDMIREEEKPSFGGGGPGPTRVLHFEGQDKEYEAFTPDKDWMPNVVMIAKSTLVWLSQLSREYGRPITSLADIPDEELDLIARRGFSALWLIGLWERSRASARIKQICGNPEAAASAYSLFDYEIANEIGGWDALENLRWRAANRGIRLASDMVPNHTGMDGKWVYENPEYFVQRPVCPFPGYSFQGENLSSDPGVGIFLEDRYYSRTDAAVVFKRVDFRSGDTRYIYHGNDGTALPWNDTAQIDFLNPAAREAVKMKILNVAKNFPIIRFDAAMVLAKRHIRRLWYPEPGSGGDIASRGENALSRDEFDKAIPQEFWREVVDLCAKEAPDTLLLAEAFWMLEGYFTRTLGMHRVYNSAFMNMLKKEENEKYRLTMKNTMEFDPEVLKRFVNFMNNPDEDTAVAQFGKGDKYFGICTMMVAMPGLPMFGHGQVEGFEEKYGMEYRRAYWSENPDQGLVARHEREIFPLMRRRHLFSEVENFTLYDLYADGGSVNENVFAWSNRAGNDASLIIYNNSGSAAWGWIKLSSAFARKGADGQKSLERRSLSDAIGMSGAGSAASGRERFLLLREQRSGLWFLRESASVRDRGMFVSAGPYQCQVFLDLGEIVDNDMGHYRKLHDHLEGRGVKSVTWAMQDLFLGELHHALALILSEEFLDAVGNEADTTGSVRAWAKANAGNLRKFLEVARIQAGGTRDWPAFEKGKMKDASCDAIAGDAEKACVKSLADIAEGCARLTERVTAWKKEAESLINGVTGADGSESGSASPAEAGRDHGAFLHAQIEGKDWLVAAFAGFEILRLVAGVFGNALSGKDLAELFGFWGIDRKLAELLEAREADREEVDYFLALRKLGLSVETRTAPEARPAPEARAVTEPVSARNATLSPARDCLAAFVDSPAAEPVLGVHEYGGTRWFVSEGLDAIVLEIALERVFRGMAGDASDLSLLSACMKETKRLKAKSAYDFDLLRDALGLANKSAKSRKKPIEAAKEPSKKATTGKAAPMKGTKAKAADGKVARTKATQGKATRKKPETDKTSGLKGTSSAKKPRKEG